MEDEAGWACHRLESGWTAKAVGVRFYPSSAILKYIL